MLEQVLTPISLAVLVPLAVCAFVGQSVVGFGAVLVATTIGSLVVSPSELAPALITLDLGFCIALAVRHRREIDRRFLWRALVPALVLGLPIGIALITIDDEHQLMRRGVGLALMIAAAIEVWRVPRDPRPLQGAPRFAVLMLGGIAHFTTATGGLIVAYAATRALARDGQQRATLFFCWAVLDLILVMGFAQSHRTEFGTSLAIAGCLLPSCVVGLILGELLQRRLSARVKIAATYAAIALAGLALLVRG